MTDYVRYWPLVDILPWHETSDLLRIEHRCEPPRGDMQRRDRIGKPGEGTHPQTMRLNSRNAPTAPLSTDHSAEQFDCPVREPDEALERLAGSSQLLQVISGSTGDLKLIFESILVDATRICDASFANLVLNEGDDHPTGHPCA